MEISIGDIARLVSTEWKQEKFEQNSTYYEALKKGTEPEKRWIYTQMVGRLATKGRFSTQEYDKIMEDRRDNPPTDDDLWLIILLNAL